MADRLEFKEKLAGILALAEGLCHRAAGACRGCRTVRYHAGNYEPSAAHGRLHGAGSCTAGGGRTPGNGCPRGSLW